ncbi:MAG: hypothetical protein ACTHOE_01825 [Conexibacter sp.]
MSLALTLVPMVVGVSGVGGADAPGPPCVQGTPSRGWCGDGGPAVRARLASPGSIVSLPGGGFVFSDTLNSAIREVTSDGVIHTIATLGVDRIGCWPGQLAAAPDGRLLVVSPNCASVFRISWDGTVTLVAGHGGPFAVGASADGDTPRISLVAPTGVAVSGEGTTWIADGTALVRVDPDGSARRIPLDPAFPLGTIQVVPGGSLLVSAPTRRSLWLVDPATGRAHRAEGCSDFRLSLCDVGSVDSTTGRPAEFAVLPSGDLLLAERDDDQIERFGHIHIGTRIAGDGAPGFAGDGGPAAAARLFEPSAVAARADGSLLVADAGNDRIRLISTAHTIQTVAGSGSPAWRFQPTAMRAPPACGRSCGDINYDRLWNYFYLSDRPLRARAGSDVVIHFVTSRAASVVLQVLAGGARVARRHARVGAGRVTMRLRPLHRGRYAVTLTGSASGDTASDGAPLTVR